MFEYDGRECSQCIYMYIVEPTKKNKKTFNKQHQTRKLNKLKFIHIKTAKEE